MLEVVEIFIIAISVALIAVVKLFDKNPPPILGIYQRPNGLYWLKVISMYVVLSLRKLKPVKKDEEEQRCMDIEKPQKLSIHDKAIDAVYLNGASKNGDYLVVGTARRKNLLVDGFIYLKINESNLGLLETPKLPDTSLYKKEDNNEYAAEGLKMTLIEPMKKWRFTYEGKMKEFRNETVSHDVRLDGIWISTLPYFNYDTDMDPWCMAKSLAYEKWSRNFFNVLKVNHQTHYEQFGIMKVNVSVNGQSYNFELDTVRDHSFGLYRDWAQFRRYGLHFFTTANGDRFSVGKVCMPIAFSRLTIGFAYLAKEKKVFPVKDCDLELFQHGELGLPPLDYAFRFSVGNKKFTVQVNVVDSPYFYISKDWEAKIYERLCTFKVNGVKGWGAAEWQYRNIEGKFVEDYSKNKDVE